MFKKSKDPSRVINLVQAVRQPTSLGGVTEEFDSYNAKISSYLSSSLAPSTSESYFLSFNRFSKFCVENNVPVLPTNVEVFMTFLIKISEEAVSAAPAKLMRSAVRHFNILNNPSQPSPTDREDISLLIRSFDRKFAKPVRKSDPTTIVIIQKLIDSLLNGDQLRFFNFQKSVEDWQLVAKTVVNFYCFARFEEVLDLKLSNFDFQPSGHLVVTFFKSKNNQFHDAKKCTIAPAENALYCPVNIVKKYIDVMNFPKDSSVYFLPRFVQGTPKFLLKTNYAYCVSKFKAGLLKIGVNPEKFGEHSDRIGGLSAAANAGCSISELQTHGRWKSDYAPKLYHKKSLFQKEKVSNVLNEL